MRWEVHLEGDKSGLEELEKSFNDEPKVEKRDDERDYVLLSSRFGGEDVDLIREIAEDIVTALRSFGVRDSINVDELTASNVYKISEDGSVDAVYVRAQSAVMRITGSATVTVGSDNSEEEIHSPADRTYEWTKLAIEDDAVLELSELLENGDSWVNMYRIYEFIQANIQVPDNIVEQGWWSEDEKRLFKQTANSRDAIGDDARHGQSSIPAPEEPMTHSEAKRLIDTLVDKWLHHRR